MSDADVPRSAEVRPETSPRRADREHALPLLIATILPEQGTTGVQTHFRELRRYLDRLGARSDLVTPSSWGRPLTVPVFGFRRLLEWGSKPAGVRWYRHWHEVFLRRALRRRLASLGSCVVYAQCPVSARAVLRARQGPHQRVVLAVHFRISQSDEWADKGQIPRGGAVFAGIRRLERQVIPQVDGLVYVSRWGRDVLVDWLPEAAPVPSAVIRNFTAPVPPVTTREQLGDLVTAGSLEPVKNHQFLLRVLAAANDAGHRLTLDIFGDGPLRAELMALAESLNLDGQVCFRGFRTDIRDFLPGYRAYVHSSYSESAPLAVIEAMAAGLPVVAADIAPILELCDEGIEARFWPLSDPRQAAGTVVSLLSREPERARAGRAARARFHRDHDADIVGPRLLRFLQASGPAGQGAAAS
jgi:glycosyltransferase involved in cell wall biosynthesis